MAKEASRRRHGIKFKSQARALNFNLLLDSVVHPLDSAGVREQSRREPALGQCRPDCSRWRTYTRSRDIESNYKTRIHQFRGRNQEAAFRTNKEGERQLLSSPGTSVEDARKVFLA